MLTKVAGRFFRRRVFFTKKPWYERLSINIPVSLVGLSLAYQYYLWTRRQPQPEAAITELSLRFQSEMEKVVTSAEVLESYSKAKQTWHSGRVPRAVLYPGSHEDVEQMVKACFLNKVPMTAYGQGTGLRGGTVLSKSGVVLDLSKMNKVKEIDTENLDCVVEPGVTVSDLNARLASVGLWLPFEEYPQWTVGGLAATNACSQYSDFNTFRGHVLSLKIVLPNGKSLWTKNRSQYGNAGYSLNDLFIGSEGTLGIITKLTLKVQPLPKSIKYLKKRSENLKNSIDLAVKLHNDGVSVAEEIEILADGTVDVFLAICEDPVSPEKRKPMKIGTDWTVLGSKEGVHRTPGSHSVFASIGVPVSKLELTLKDAVDSLKTEGLDYTIRAVPMRGEVLVQVSNPSDDFRVREQAERVLMQLTDRAILKEGTCAVNFGVGADLGKVLESDVGANSVSLQRKLKQVIDPDYLLNPGKVLPGSEAPKSFGEMLLRKLKQFWME